MRALPEAKLVHRENVAALRRLLEALAVRVDLRRPSCAGTLVRARACLQNASMAGMRSDQQSAARRANRTNPPGRQGS